MKADEMENAGATWTIVGGASKRRLLLAILTARQITVHPWTPLLPTYDMAQSSPPNTVTNVKSYASLLGKNFTPFYAKFGQ